jgi:hypothetical protein
MAITRIDHLQVNRLDVQETVVSGGTTFVDLANAATDEKAKVSSNDTTPGFLNGKLVAGANVTLTENNNGGNETLTISAASGGGLTGTNYVYVAADGTPTQNFTALVNAYATAKTKSPSANNVITVVAAPGLYNFGDTNSILVLDTPYINLVSLDGQRSIRLDSTNNASSITAISVTANNVTVVGVDTVVSQTNKFDIDTNLNNLLVINCRGWQSWNAAIVSGTFIDCTSTGGRSWGSSSTSDASGTFIRCNSLSGFAFAGEYYTGSTASGVFKDCEATTQSFGGPLATANGTFYRCVMGSSCCGSASSGTTRGATGVFINCIADGNTWQSKINGGRFYWCRKTSGTFAIVAEGGRTYYCVDGDGNTNNQ